MTAKADLNNGGGPTTSPTTSSSLLERVKTEDHGAWQRLVDLYAPLVYRWCRRTGIGAQDAADVLQEVFLAVATHVRDFRRDRPGDSFRGWLWTITRSKIHDHFRRRRNQPNAQGGSTAHERLGQIPDQPPAIPGDDPLSSDQAALAQRVVELVRREVEDRTWRAFWRLAVDGQPGPDVAAELGMSVRAVYQAKYRVLQRVRREMADLCQ